MTWGPKARSRPGRSRHRQARITSYNVCYTKLLRLDGQVVGNRVVVVGERGHVLVSDDAGHSWVQRPAPTRATLTSVFFVNERLGWAAGHDTAILRTVDGGESWQLVHEDQAVERPILDLWFKDERLGYSYNFV